MLYDIYLYNPNSKKWGHEQYYTLIEMQRSVDFAKKNSLMLYSDIKYTEDFLRRDCNTFDNSKEV